MKSAVIITGALGGIGVHLCREFSNRGYAVIAIDRADGKVPCHTFLHRNIREVVQSAEARNKLVIDVRKVIDGDGLALRGLVNNAAIQILGGVVELSVEDWQETLETNLLAPFFLSQCFLSDLEQHLGAIVNISSIHEKLTKEQFVAYSTSKAALSGLTRAMAVNLGSRVRVNAICPAAIDTPMLKAGFEGNPEAFDALHSAHPVGRIGQPIEVARLAHYLVEEASAFLTGSSISLDGAISSRLHDPD